MHYVGLMPHGRATTANGQGQPRLWLSSSVGGVMEPYRLTVYHPRQRPSACPNASFASLCQLPERSQCQSLPNGSLGSALPGWPYPNHADPDDDEGEGDDKGAG